MAQEVRDAHQLCRWASDTIRRALRADAGNPHLFEETALPLLCGTSFRGSVDDLVAFLTTLEREAHFIYVAGTDACAKGALDGSKSVFRRVRNNTPTTTRAERGHAHHDAAPTQLGGQRHPRGLRAGHALDTWNEMRDESRVRLGIMEAETPAPCPPPP